MSIAAERYLSDRVGTASPAELVAMLYDAAVTSVRGAIAKHMAGEHYAAVPMLVKAQRIVMHLRSTLNMDAGPLADNLFALYTWTWEQLVQANSGHDTKAARAALDTLEELRDAWRQGVLLRSAS